MKTRYRIAPSEQGLVVTDPRDEQVGKTSLRLMRDAAEVVD
jgi:hypothetical protein